MYFSFNTIKRIFILLSLFFLTISIQCRKQGLNVIEKGDFIDKIVCVGSNDLEHFDPMITVYDLYKNENSFELLNRMVLTKGVVPYISKDRTWIAYILIEGNLFPMRINEDRTQNVRIQFPATLTVQDISISPDGNQIAVSFHPYSGWESGVHLGIMNHNGTNFHTIYADSGRCLSPDWSPDGSFIYFLYVDVVNKYGQNSPDIFFLPSYICKVKTDGTDLTVLKDMTNELIPGSCPSVSPFGDKIAFVSRKNYPENTFTELFVMNADGSNIIQLTEAIIDRRQEDGYYNIYTRDNRPRWTKDGEYILFHREIWQWDNDKMNYNDTYDLYIIHNNGSNMQRLTNNGMHRLFKKGL